MPKRTLYEQKKTRSEDNIVYEFHLKIKKEDAEHYDFRKMIRFLALEWDCTMREAILISLKDSFEKLTPP